MRRLDGGVYRIEVGGGVLAAAGLAAVMIALATVCLHAATLARAPPVTAVRNEWAVCGLNRRAAEIDAYGSVG